ncbi:hypothetical protein FE840_001160 [Peteryoungia desertarenae]|uniref:Uncharacterized protein n=1 Tax=Peteryoungia desertarenae TaxID=1813451 RepID=A0ABX6QJ06_9HYPH|nr:hypothetical protein [Peteryoungia desertarenae]QLF68272.1 hypothetical protein FE840_001160 [Peteryoungia desertarenae]
MKILFLIACACVIAATIGALAIGLTLFTQPEAYAALDQPHFFLQLTQFRLV